MYVLLVIAGCFVAVVVVFSFIRKVKVGKHLAQNNQIENALSVSQRRTKEELKSKKGELEALNASTGRATVRRHFHEGGVC